MTGAALSAQVAIASQLYLDGKAVTARQSLITLLADPAGDDPATRLAVLDRLLDICVRSYADQCLVEYVAAYLKAAEAAPVANDVQRGELLRKAGYYLAAARLASGRPEMIAASLSDPTWTAENAFNGELYVRRQLLAARAELFRQQPAAAIAHIDKALSLLASLKTSSSDRTVLANGLAEAIGLLAQLGQTERAFGLLKTVGGFIGDELAPASVEGAEFAVTTASLLTDFGDTKAALPAATLGVTRLRSIELDDDTRDWLQGAAIRQQALLAAASGDLALARRMIDAHPLAQAYEHPGRTAESYDEVAYVAVRAYVAAAEGKPDPMAAAALSAPGAAEADVRIAEEIAVTRAAGLAFSQATEAGRREALWKAVTLLRAKAARAGRDPPGGWYRPGTVDLTLASLALGAFTADDPATNVQAFDLMQLTNRVGPSFDADALAALGHAGDELQRRAIHQTLRLRARRDQLERAQLQSVIRSALATRTPDANLGHDHDLRSRFRDYVRLLASTEAQLTGAGIALSGANLVSLAQLQAVLAPDEAALTLAPTAAGLAYMCVRRARIFRAAQPVDFARFALDRRIVQAALTADHAPSEVLDRQFPAEAAVRLYDVLIRPFEPCLKPGDRIVWLPSFAFVGLPLAALLPIAPPRVGAGYDLAAAQWLIRRHAVSYAGSAAVVVASRHGSTGAAASFDFLGTGDPRLSGALAELPALPDTRAELEASAKGFATARLLMGEAATEKAFRRELIGDYRFLSFATHGLLREDLQGLSEPALVLTPGLLADHTDDGLLTAPEIADLNLKAVFVALSACNTANFDLNRAAQDLPALASAFAVAGVPATLGTLWPVESATARAVVSAIFGRLRGDPGLGPAAALAEAQRAQLAAPAGAAFLHPRFWAPFVILGDGGAPTAGPVRAAPTMTRVERLAGIGEAIDPPGRPPPPRFTFAARGPHGEVIDLATRTLVGRDVVLTRTARFAPLAHPLTYSLDDWDDPLCISEPVTWIERRDAASDAVKASVEVRGLEVAAALASGDHAWLGGSRTATCGAATRGVVVALGADLSMRTLYDDASLGASAVWSLSPLARGQVFVAATKGSMVDVWPAGVAYSGMAFTLKRDGRASPPRLLDAGSQVLVNRADASAPGDVRLAGGVGGEGAVFHLAIP